MFDPVLSVTPESILRASRGISAPFGPIPYIYSWDAPWNRDMIPFSFDSIE